MTTNADGRPDRTDDDWSDIWGILDAQRFAVLSTHHRGQPYSGLVAFAATDSLKRLLFCTPRTTRKYENILQDHRAAMLFHTARNAPSDFVDAMSVTATGHITEIVDTDDKCVDYAAALSNRHPGLESFIAEPDTAIMAMDVSEYHLLRNFQEIVRVNVGLGHPAGKRSDTAVVLLAHGSRDEKWRTWFEGVSDSLSGSLGRGQVRAAYLQFSSPTLIEAVSAAAKEGFDKIAVLPVFISAGGHAMKDVPQQVATVQDHFSGLEITVLPRVGQDRGFEHLIRNLAMRAVGQ